MVALIILSGVPLKAQTAQVIELPKETADRVKSLYEQKAKIEADIEAERQKIEEKILHPLRDKLEERYNKSNGIWFASGDEGWPNGFEYSSDFRFIVPKQSPPVSIQNYPGCSWISPVTSNAIQGTVPYIINSITP